MAQVQYDLSRMPVIVISVAGVPTDADLEAHLVKSLSFMSRGQAVCYVYDTDPEVTLSSQQRERILRFQRENAALHKQRLAGVAIVTSSIWLRTLLRAITAVQPPSFDIRYFADRDEAIRWANDQVLAAAALHNTGVMMAARQNAK